METDFFGYQRNNAGSYLYSSDFASVYFENSAGGSAATPAQRAGLVQNCTVAYQQNVQPRFEAGSHELYWLAGQALGSIQMGRLIGDAGILNGVSVGGGGNDLRNGILGGIDFKIGRKGSQLNASTAITTTQSVLVLRGCVLSGYGASFSTGGLEVQEAMTIQTALMRRSVSQSSLGAAIGAAIGAAVGAGL